MFRDGERAAKEWLDSRGEAWEPDAFYEDYDQPVTLEDFERDREQIRAADQRDQIRIADGQAQSLGGLAASRFAAGDTAQSQESTGSRGDGTGVAGRGDGTAEAKTLEQANRGWLFTPE